MLACHLGDGRHDWCNRDTRLANRASAVGERASRLPSPANLPGVRSVARRVRQGPGALG